MAKGGELYPVKYIRWFFSCKHPAYWLRWDESVSTEVTPIDEDFEGHTMKCHCDKCGKDVTLSFARLIGGVDGFMQRGRGRGGHGS